MEEGKTLGRKKGGVKDKNFIRKHVRGNTTTCKKGRSKGKTEALRRGRGWDFGKKPDSGAES